jgi:ABC-2 type transport system ATP-binding protein
LIEVRQLRKSFGGRPAIRDVTFSIRKGEVLGFLGPNGAGKTTTMRILTCYLSPDSGAASVCGFDVFEEPMQVKRRIGYLPQTPPLYPEMSVEGYLGFVARIRGIPRAQRRRHIDSAMEKCGLGPDRRRIIANLSNGFKQRVGLAQAILHDPPVLILDEPTVGLDPEQIIEIRDLIKGMSGEHTVILSTHILPEVEVICSKVAIISYGEIVKEGSLAELGSGADVEKIRIRLARGGPRVKPVLAEVEGVISAVEDNEPGVYLVDAVARGAAREQIAAAAVHNDFGLLELVTVTRTLEEIYLEATRKLSSDLESGGTPADPVEADSIRPTTVEQPGNISGASTASKADKAGRATMAGGASS